MMHYALPNKKRYPIETEDQIKTAEVYFGKYFSNIRPAERVTIANNMEKRASELNFELTDPSMTNYSRSTDSSVSPNFGVHMNMRKEACLGKTVNIGNKNIDAVELLDKIASYGKPAKIVELLTDFDKKANLEGNYDKEIRDPFYTVFGHSSNPTYSHTKIASGLTKEQLQKASNDNDILFKLTEKYGKGFVADFTKKPATTLNSMPVPDQEVIIRIINGK